MTTQFSRTERRAPQTRVQTPERAERSDEARALRWLESRLAWEGTLLELREAEGTGSGQAAVGEEKPAAA
jgi:hypothetical protein